MDQKSDILVLYAEHFMSHDEVWTNKNIRNISYDKVYGSIQYKYYNLSYLWY